MEYYHYDLNTNNKYISTLLPSTLDILVRSCQQPSSVATCTKEEAVAVEQLERRP